MANSINTNVGAMVALQNLNATGRELNVTQNRVNTGLKVASAKDNGAIFAIASGLRAEQGALDSVKNSIQRGISVIDVALAAVAWLDDLAPSRSLYLSGYEAAVHAALGTDVRSVDITADSAPTSRVIAPSAAYKAIRTAADGGGLTITITRVP